MGTRTLTVRGVPEPALKALRARAEANHRSLNGELLSIIQGAAAAPDRGPATHVRETPVASYEASPEPAASVLEAVDPRALAAVCRRHHIRWLALFGSHAEGRPRADSDVDVVVDFEPGMTPGLGIVRVAEALRPVLGNRPVDLVTRRGLAPRLRERVLATAKPLYGA